jgi:hypothetical protein
MVEWWHCQDAPEVNECILKAPSLAGIRVLPGCRFPFVAALRLIQ